MSAPLGYLNIQLTLEQAKFQSNLEKVQRKAKQFFERTTKYLNNIEKAASSINSNTRLQLKLEQLGYLKQAAQVVIKYADAHTELSNCIRLVTDDSFTQARGIQSVFDIALQTNQSVSATSTIYQRFARNAEQLGLKDHNWKNYS